MRQAIEGWLRIVLIVLFIFVVVGGLVWFGAGLYANITENNSTTELPDFPDIAKAEYAVAFKATGNIILTDRYSKPSEGRYTLHGYWEARDGKYRYNDIDLTVDEVYFGDIIITKRRE